jgi:hypothetical protein
MEEVIIRLDDLAKQLGLSERVTDSDPRYGFLNDEGGEGDEGAAASADEQPPEVPADD